MRHQPISETLELMSLVFSNRKVFSEALVSARRRRTRRKWVGGAKERHYPLVQINSRLVAGAVSFVVWLGIFDVFSTNVIEEF